MLITVTVTDSPGMVVIVVELGLKSVYVVGTMVVGWGRGRGGWGEVLILTFKHWYRC